MAEGRVALVGGGPGDPGLLTLRGARLLREADAVVYDRLVASELLTLAPPHAERIYVGKAAGRHALSQDEINALLVRLAREGKRVVRLKGGDPFVFGRGGEEALALAEAQVPFELVPGVTSAVAAPAWAGIPVTHRGVASSFAVATGHEDPSKERSALAWERLACATDTLVVLMGAERVAELARALIQHGRPPEQPAALIEWGTTARQRVVSAPLRDLPRVAEEAGIGPPTVLVVGEVVALRGSLDWFRPGPLAGVRVLVTRARDQASQLSQMLAERGALPFEFPTIEVVWLADPAPLDRELERLAEFDWVVFTSVNGVRAVFQRLGALNLDARAFARTRLCAIGPATAAELAQRGLRADWVPTDFLSRAILNGFAERGVAGSRFLLPRADIASPELAAGLRALGATVVDLAAYSTRPASQRADEIRDLLEAGEVDVVTFTSSSTVRNLWQALGGRPGLLSAVKTVCIGPVTAETARALGLRVDAVATVHTIEGLVDAVVDLFNRPTERAIRAGSAS